MPAQFVAISLATVGSMLVLLGLFLLSAILSVAMQGKPLDVISTVIGLVLLASGALLLRSAWRRWQGAARPPD